MTTDIPGLEVGKIVSYCNMIPNSVVGAIDALIQSNGIRVSYIHWTDPPEADPNKKCRAVHVLRTDGMSETDIERARAGTRCENHAGTAFLFDPVAWNLSWPENLRYARPKRQKVAKPSKVGWERMAIGESRIVRLALRDVKLFLTAAMLQRNLAWTFEVRRLRHLEGDKPHRSVRVWEVKRVT